MTCSRWAVLALTLCFAAAMLGGVAAVEAAAASSAGMGGGVLRKKEAVAEKPRKAKARKAGPIFGKAAKGGKMEKKKKAAQTAARNSKSAAKNGLRKRSSGKQAVDSRRVWMESAQSGNGLLGKASWYGSDFHGGLTASGERYDMYTDTAAHRTLPLGTVVEVTDAATGRKVMVCINNRGPYKRGRVIDLSYAAAEDLGIKKRGVAAVNLKVISDAQGRPVNSDEAFYVRLGEERRTERADDVGPFSQFADASVMKEVLRIRYPEAAIVMGPAVAGD